MFTLKIQTDNAAFDGNKLQTVARLLIDIAGKLRQKEGSDGGKIQDENGNTVGSWQLTK